MCWPYELRPATPLVHDGMHMQHHLCRMRHAPVLSTTRLLAWIRAYACLLRTCQQACSLVAVYLCLLGCFVMHVCLSVGV